MMREEDASRALTFMVGHWRVKLEKASITLWMEHLLTLDAKRVNRTIKLLAGTHKWFPALPEFDEAYQSVVMRDQREQSPQLPSGEHDRQTSPEQAKKNLQKLREQIATAKIGGGSGKLVCVRHAPNGRAEEYAKRMATRDRKHYIECTWCSSVPVDLDALPKAHNHVGDTWEECPSCRAEWAHLLPTEANALPSCPRCETHVERMPAVDGCGYYCPACNLLYEGTAAERDSYRYGTGTPRTPGKAAG